MTDQPAAPERPPLSPLAAGYEAITLFHERLVRGVSVSVAQREALMDLADRLRRDDPTDSARLAVAVAVVGRHEQRPYLLLAAPGSYGPQAESDRQLSTLPVAVLPDGQEPDVLARTLVAGAFDQEIRVRELVQTRVYRSRYTAGPSGRDVTIGYLAVLDEDFPPCRQADDWRDLNVLRPWAAHFTGEQHLLVADAIEAFGR